MLAEEERDGRHLLTTTRGDQGHHVDDSLYLLHGLWAGTRAAFSNFAFSSLTAICTPQPEVFRAILFEGSPYLLLVVDRHGRGWGRGSMLAVGRVEGQEGRRANMRRSRRAGGQRGGAGGQEGGAIRRDGQGQCGPTQP